MSHTHSHISHEEQSTRFVVLVALAMMVIEITAGLLSHSMALTADGIHMGSHVVAIGISWAAYVLVRRLQRRGNGNYDSQKILNLSAYTSGITLLVVAVVIIVEALERLLEPDVAISFGQAMVVAVIGLVVNGVCAWVLHGRHGHGDMNTRAAFLHVAGDVLTSLGTIVGLLCAKHLGITWVDAAVALLSAALIISWAIKLLLTTGRTLTLKQD